MRLEPLHRQDHLQNHRTHEPLDRHKRHSGQESGGFLGFQWVRQSVGLNQVHLRLILQCGVGREDQFQFFVFLRSGEAVETGNRWEEHLILRLRHERGAARLRRAHISAVLLCWASNAVFHPFRE